MTLCWHKHSLLGDTRLLVQSSSIFELVETQWLHMILRLKDTTYFSKFSVYIYHSCQNISLTLVKLKTFIEKVHASPKAQQGSTSELQWQHMYSR